MRIERPNRVWAVDITYIPMEKGFMYLFAIIDIYSRYVVGWSLSNTMSTEWCVETVEQAISAHGEPEIINSDQGSQFTSDLYVECLESTESASTWTGKAGRKIMCSSKGSGGASSTNMYTCMSMTTAPPAWA